MPVPNYAWNLINDWVTQNRIWVIPDAGEEFDNDKAAFYSRMNESIIRVPDCSGVSGRELRKAYFADDFDFFSNNIPSSIVDLYWNKRDHMRQDMAASRT